jgi:hypothetical protein
MAVVDDERSTIEYKDGSPTRDSSQVSQLKSEARKEWKRRRESINPPAMKEY